MAVSHTPNGDTPVSSMNMTPLIDVFLVLLVMFIITIPIASHLVEVGLGGTDEITKAPDPVINKVVISQSDAILWNDELITKIELAGLLKASTLMTPEPALHFEPEAQASYQTSAEVLREIKVSGVTNFGFVGNEKYRRFD
ncbi:biopolymer transporter ExbD [uncultured Erythrobacter sp.]|uniref:ExbD/TolR family protein n=1 Tax=uncultured Erythrobacter sp. TaxID=263913 RepID=UPI00261AA922|nr:biopolymer transporter ExbD [uncultured Erythrobacter sp.]